MKRILVFPAGLYYVRAFAEIKDLGYHVLGIDRDENAPAFELCDEHSVIDIQDRERALEYAREKGVDGVMALNDFGVRSAAYIAQSLNLPGINLATAICTNDKGIMRDVWKSEGLPQPDYGIVSEYGDCRAAASRIGYPVVVKPTDCGGAGRGISIARGESEMKDSFTLASPFAANGRIIVEQFIDGVESTIEALSCGGEVHVLAMSDKVKPPQKYRVATDLNYPAFFPPAVKEKICGLVRRAVAVMGVVNGASHTEVIVNAEGEPVLVEMGSRGGGGHVFHTIVKEVSGVNMAQELARILCGESPRLATPLERGCVYHFFNPPSGVIKEIRGVEEIEKMDFVLDFGLTAGIGDSFAGLTDSLQRVGFVVVRGKDREEAISNAVVVDERLEFIVEE